MYVRAVTLKKKLDNVIAEQLAGYQGNTNLIVINLSVAIFCEVVGY